MKKLFSYLVLGSIGLPFINTPADADTNYHLNNSDIIEVFESSVSGSTISFTKLTTFDRSSNNNVFFGQEGYWFDESQNKLYFQEMSGLSQVTGRHWVYDLTNSAWSATTISSDTSDTNVSYSTIPSSYSDTISTNTSNISANTSNISTNTSNISTNTSNIATNTSAIETLQSSNNLSEAKITANTNNINNLGEGVAGSTALTAALSALPQTSKESKLSCGVGTGAYSSRYAVGFGCASKVNERVDINAGGSYVFGGSKSYGGGTLDSGVVKAGFVFKLGELKKPTQISFKDKKIIDQKISNLVKDNQNLKTKNNEIISQNQKLLARLEKLENIALKFQSSSEMISVATTD